MRICFIFFLQIYLIKFKCNLFHKLYPLRFCRFFVSLETNAQMVCLDIAPFFAIRMVLEIANIQLNPKKNVNRIFVMICTSYIQGKVTEAGDKFK